MNVSGKRLLSLLLAILMVFTMMPTTAFATETDDEQTAGLTIGTVDELETFAQAVNNGNTYVGETVTLTADLDLSGEEWTPIGNGTRSSKSYNGAAFKGTFDGGGHIISGLTITSSTSADTAVGLFGVVDGGMVQNLKLTGVNINVTDSNLAGGAIGMMLNGATADRITVSGAVTGYDGVGGIVGRLIISGTISNCVNNASVTSAYGGIGGIVGKAYYEDSANTSVFASITGCTNNGTVTAPMYVGGIVGLARANVTNCVNNGAVVGGTQTGGIVGQLIAAGTVSGNENKAKITGTNHMGGIIGDYTQTTAYTYYEVTISDNINRGELVATENCAAIMGCNNIANFTGITASGNVSYYTAEGLELFLTPYDMEIDDSNSFVLVKIGNSNYATLDDAIAAANAMTDVETVTIEIYGKTEYTDATASLTGSYDTINFVGKSDTAEICITRNGSNGYISGEGNDCAVNFADLILSKSAGSFAGDAGFMNCCFSVYRVASVTYTDCVFPNGACAAGCETTYTGCSFSGKSYDKYSLWAYGTDVTVDDCTFTAERGIKMYAEGAAKTTALTVTDSKFETTGTKPAIVLTYGESVTLSGNTYPDTGVLELEDNGSSNGTVIESTDKVTCVSDAYPDGCGVLVGNQIYRTVAEASAVVEADDTVTLLHDSAETVELPEGVTLDKNGYEAAGVTVKVTVPDLTINTAADLKAFAEAVNGGNTYADKLVVLGGNIDLNDEAWTPIGASGDSKAKFYGTFDGKGYTISNLYVKQGAAYHAAGLFGATCGTIKNLTIDGAYVESLSSGSATVNGTAVLAGSTAYGATIDNVHVKNATVKGNRYVAGIVGYMDGAVTNCSVENVTIIATPDDLTGSYDNGDKVGGIVGYTNCHDDSAATISGCELKGTVSLTGYRDIGGIVGMVQPSAVVSNNTNSADVTVTVDQKTGYYGEKTANAGEFIGRGTASSASTGNTTAESATFTTETKLPVTGLSGEGTEASPYLINNLDELKWFRDDVNRFAQDGSSQYTGKYIKLTADINLDENGDGVGEEWEPIGSTTVDHGSFYGIFDGGDHTISNLVVSKHGTGSGFFAKVSGIGDGPRAVVKNITFHNVDVDAGDSNSYAGGVIANAGGNSVVSNVKLTGYVYVNGYGYVGGIIGHGYPDMDKCSVSAEEGSYIHSNYWCAGGIIGYAGEGGTPITNCSVSGVDIWSAYGAAAAVAGLLQYGNTLTNVTASNVEITSNSDYCMGYIAGNGEASTMTGITMSNVTATANGNPITATDAVATVDGTTYFSLQDAVNAGGTVTLMRDVVLADTVTVPADRTVVLELNGKTISQTKAQTGNYQMILNDGNLTIQDSVGNGKISYTDTVGGNFISNTITNRGTLTLKSGTVENMSADAVADAGFPYAIDTSIWGAADAVNTIIEGGKVYCESYSALRLRADSETEPVNITISGGEVYGRIEVQNPTSNKATKGQLTISGGVIKKNNSSKAIMIFGGGGTAENMKASITGGTIDGPIGYSTSFPIANFDENVITGGTFTDVSARSYLADGYELKVNDDGTFGVQVAPASYIASVNGVDYTDLQEAVDTAGEDDIIYLKGNVVLSDTLVIKNEDKITLNLAGYTISQEKACTEAYSMIVNQGVLTIRDTVGGGKISFTDTGAGDSAATWGAYTITNNNTLVVTGGTIENLSAQNVDGQAFSHTVFAIQQSSGAVSTIISGNAVISTPHYRSIRVNGGTLTITGGTFDGQIWMQPFVEGTAISITGGSFDKNWNDASAVFVENASKSVDLAVSGGTYNGKIGCRNADALAGSITGGIFSEAAKSGTNAALLSAAMMFPEQPNAEGYYEVVKNPLIITSVEDLKAFRDSVNAGETYQGKTITLAADIDLNNEAWTPIGNATNKFQGTFDGQDHKISNLVIDMAGKSDVGLFGMTTNGEVKNLTVENAKVTGRLNVGVVAGTPYTSKYTKIKVTGHVEVNGMAYVGGVGGKNAYANWTDITVNVDSTSYVKATSTEDGTAYRTYVGGVIGFMGEGGHTFKNISANINVIGDVCDVGGITGIAHYGNNFENVTYSGKVTNTNSNAEDVVETGLIAGVWYNAAGYTVTFTEVSATGTVSAPNAGVTFDSNSLIGAAYAPTNASAGTLKVNGEQLWPLVAQVGEKQYATLTAALAAAKAGDEVILLSDVNESIEAFTDVMLTTNVAEGVTVTSTYTGWLSITNLTVGKGVTLHTNKVLFDDAGVNVIEGAIEVDATFYNAYDSKTTIQNGGKISSGGMIVNRYHSNADSGIYVYGDGDDTTVEVSSVDTIGTYSGTFYVKDAVIDAKLHFWIDYLKNDSQESDSYAQSTPVFENSVLNVASELRFYKDATLTLTGTEVTAGKVQIRQNATPTVTMDSSSVITATSVENLTGATLNAVLNDDGTVSFKLATKGSGTAEDPFQISTLAELKAFRDAVNAGNTYDNQYFKLTADIDLNNELWTPIGNGTNKFLGTFDGDEHTISNLYVDVDTNNAGLFGFASVIKNVKLVNANVTGLVCVGALVGELESSVGTLDNCHVSGTIQITGENSVGGLAGKGYANIKNCSVDGGSAETSFVMGVYGTTEEGDNIGGIIGHLGEGGTLGVTGSTAKNIKVVGTRKIGGIVGTTNRTNDYVGNSVSGLVIESTATAEYADDNASTTTIGGIIGNYFGTATSGGILQNSTVDNVKFIPGNAKSAGPLAGGDRENNGGAPVGIEASGNSVDFTTVKGSTNFYLMSVAAKIGDVPYSTLAKAFEAANPGDTVTILAGSFTQNLDVNKAITVVGETDAEGNNLVNFTGKLNVTADGATVKNINVNNGSSSAGYINAKNVVIEGCSVVGGNGFRYCYTGGTVTFKNSTITGSTYGIHFDGNCDGNVVIEGCTITGWTSFASTIDKVTISDTKFAEGNYNQLRFYQNSELTNVTFNEKMNIDFGVNETTADFTNCSVVDAEGNPSSKSLTDVIYLPDLATMGIKVTENGSPVVVVASVGDEYYLSLQEALDAAAAATGEVTVKILSDINLTGVTWNPVTVSAPGYPVVTVNGNNKTITGLTDMLFAGTWAGKSGLIINDLTIKDSTIVHDANDEAGNIGVGAFIGYPQASETITLNNCHLVNSRVEGGHWTGGLIGMAGGYNGNDGPVFMNLTIIGCSVTGSTITGKGSVGGVIGHGSCAEWTKVVIENTTVSGNTITSTGSSANKAGAIMGTIGAAGQSTTANGETKTGGASVAATVSGNTVTSAGTTITTIYGRQGTSTGMLEVAGGTYDKYPIEEGVSYAAPIEGYVIKQNENGTYGLVEDPSFGKEAKIGDVYYETIEEALAAVRAGETILLVNDVTIESKLSIPVSMTINGDGHTLTYTGADRAIDVTKETNGANLTLRNLTLNFTSGYSERGINYNTNGKLTLSNVTVNGEDVTYALNLPGSSSGATVAISKSNLTGRIALNIWGKNVTANVMDSNLVSADNTTVENYAAVKLNNDGATSAEGSIVTIMGGSVIARDENGEPSAAVTNGTETGIVSIPYENDETSEFCTTVVGAKSETVAIVEYGGTEFYGCSTLQIAIDKAIETNAASVRLIRDITLSESVQVNGKVTLDLNGHTITGTDKATSNFGLFHNTGELTIQDNSEAKSGKITLVAENDNGWMRYSSVISNNPGGKVIVESGTIKHLGGTSMSYGIDNLTNGKGTYAETALKTISRAVSSRHTKRAQFPIGAGLVLSKMNYIAGIGSKETENPKACREEIFRFIIRSELRTL